MTLEVYERWLPVIGWEAAYEVSDLGRVRSRDRLIWRKDGTACWQPGRVLKPYIDSNGYLAVRLCRAGRAYRYRVHLLVMAAWLPPRPAGFVARHGPGGTLDNRVANLCWGTPAQNSADQVRDGTWAHGERGGRAKLTDAIVVICRQRRADGETVASLAREFGISSGPMSQAVNGRTWKHVPMPALT